MKKKFNFKGYDWTELADYFGVKIFINSTKEAEPLKEFLKSKIYCNGVEQNTIKACRAYLKELIKFNMYSTPLWKGLLKIKHDWTFMIYFIDLVDGMWS